MVMAAPALASAESADQPTSPAASSSIKCSRTEEEKVMKTSRSFLWMAARSGVSQAGESRRFCARMGEREGGRGRRR